MVQKSGDHHPGWCKNLVNNGINYLSLNWWVYRISAINSMHPPGKWHVPFKGWLGSKDNNQDDSKSMINIRMLQRTTSKNSQGLSTPPKFNIAPEKWWLEDYFPIGKVTFQGLC